MIGKVAIEPRALDVLPGAGLDVRIQNKPLAETIVEYGLLSLIGAKDAEELTAAIRAQTDGLGYGLLASAASCTYRKWVRRTLRDTAARGVDT